MLCYSQCQNQCCAEEIKWLRPPLPLQGATRVSVGFSCLKRFLHACKPPPGCDEKHICAEICCCFAFVSVCSAAPVSVLCSWLGGVPCAQPVSGPWLPRCVPSGAAARCLGACICPLGPCVPWGDGPPLARAWGSRMIPGRAWEPLLLGQ